MTMQSAPAAKLVITLLHGTFAKDATWVNPEGRMATALKARFGDAVAIESPLRWSGANSFDGRTEATELLQRHILRPRPAAEGASHLVIAHSHAGNVVAYAARNAAIEAKLAGVVTLATPFIVARERNLGRVGTVAAQAMVLWLVLALYWLCALWLGARLGSAPDAALSAGGKIALIVGLALLVEIPGLRLVAAGRRRSAALLDQLAHAPVPRERLLILRQMADEATTAITFLQVPSMMTSLLFGKLAGWTDAIVRRCERLAQRPLLAVGACLLLLPASAAPGALALWLTGSELLMTVVLIAGMCLTCGPIIFMILRNRHLAYVTAAGCMAIPLAPAVLLVACAAWLAYGRRFALAHFDLDISVESTPVGEYGLTLLAPASAADPDRPGELLHSALYNDDRAIEIIGDFIETRLAFA